MNPRPPTAAAHAQSDLWAQQSSSVLRDSSTLRVCAISPCLLSCMLFIPVVFLRKHSISNLYAQVMMQKRNLMKMRTMFPQKIGKRSTQSLFTKMRHQNLLRVDIWPSRVLTSWPVFIPQQEIMVGSMYQAETPAGLCKYKDNEKGKQAPVCHWFQINSMETSWCAQIIIGSRVCLGEIHKYYLRFCNWLSCTSVYLCKISCQPGDQRLT